MELSSDALDDTESWPVPYIAADDDDDFITTPSKRSSATPIGKLVCDVCSKPETSMSDLVTCSKCSSMG